MPVALKTDAKETAKMLYYQGFNVPDVAAKTGLNLATLRTWIRREFWAKTKAQGIQAIEQPAKQCVAIEVARDLAQASKQLRSDLSEELQSQVAVLKKAPPGSIAELGGRDGRAAVVKTIVESVGKVHGWDSDHAKTLVNINVLSQPIDTLIVESEVIDVDATPKP